MKQFPVSCLGRRRLDTKAERIAAKWEFICSLNRRLTHSCVLIWGLITFPPPQMPASHFWGPKAWMGLLLTCFSVSSALLSPAALYIIQNIVAITHHVCVRVCTILPLYVFLLCHRENGVAQMNSTSFSC